MASEHILEGLEPDNLLAFLALLGVLRTLETAEPAWHARVYWAGLPSRPRLVLPVDVTRENLLEAAARGCETLAEVHTFNGRKDLNCPVGGMRDLLAAEARSASPANRRNVDLLSALTSDAVQKDDGTIKPTPFCAMFGQGHQHFLERLETVPKGIPPKELAKELSESDLNSPNKLAEALFAAWDRKDRTQSFRWDPLEDRRYALRFEDPSTDKGLTVHGANRLAALALPLLTVVPVRVKNQIRLRAVGTSWNPEGGLQIGWPIWTRPASLKAILAMLSADNGSGHPGLGIEAIYFVDRISVGKFFNFTRAMRQNTRL